MMITYEYVAHVIDDKTQKYKIQAVIYYIYYIFLEHNIYNIVYY